MAAPRRGAIGSALVVLFRCWRAPVDPAPCVPAGFRRLCRDAGKPDGKTQGDGRHGHSAVRPAGGRAGTDRGDRRRTGRAARPRRVVARRLFWAGLSRRARPALPDRYGSPPRHGANGRSFRPTIYRGGQSGATFPLSRRHRRRTCGAAVRRPRMRARLCCRRQRPHRRTRSRSGAIAAGIWHPRNQSAALGCARSRAGSRHQHGRRRRRGAPRTASGARPARRRPADDAAAPRLVLHHPRRARRRGGERNRSGYPRPCQPACELRPDPGNAARPRRAQCRALRARQQRMDRRTVAQRDRTTDPRQRPAPGHLGARHLVPDGLALPGAQ